MTHETQHEAAEERQSLWLLVLSPSIWAAHFLVSYIVAAVWCGSTENRADSVNSLRIWIVVFGLLSLVGIGFIGKIGWRKYKLEGGSPPFDADGGERRFDQDTAEDRHRFLGAATVLLSSLSAVAVVYVCLSLLFVQNCL